MLPVSNLPRLPNWKYGNKQWQKERIGDANVICENTAFASDVFQYFNDPSSLEAKKNILSLFSATQRSYQYKNIYFSIKQ